jgi:hypothetical protein
VTFQVFSETGSCAIGGSKTKIFAVELENMTALGPAEPRCALDQSFQNGLKIEGRAADDLEYIGRSPLLLERLVPLAGEPRNLCFLAGSG